jgi:hypothetical protein
VLPRVEGLTTLRYSAEARRQLILAATGMRPTWTEAIAAELPFALGVDLTSAKSVEGHAAAVRGAVLVVRAALSARRAGAVPWVECLPVGVLRC